MLIRGTNRDTSKSAGKGVKSGLVASIAALIAALLAGNVGAFEGRELELTGAIAAIVGGLWNLLKPLWSKED